MRTDPRFHILDYFINYNINLETTMQINYWQIFFLIFSLPIIGFLVKTVWAIIKWMIPSNDILKKYADEDSWAVVTGGTDGVGLGFCQELAARGFNIVIISMEKLEITKQSLEKLRGSSFKHKKIKLIEFNFKNSSNLQKFESTISKQLQPLDICLLVNNVGTNISLNLMENVSLQECINLININCISMANMSSVVLKKMGTRTKRSAVISLSSFMGEQALTYNTMYSATKAFNCRLSQGLSLEYPNMDVLCVKPLFVESPLSQFKKNFLVPTRRQFAQQALKELRWGYEETGYPKHSIIMYLIDLVWSPIQRFVFKNFCSPLIKKSFLKAKKSS